MTLQKIVEEIKTLKPFAEEDTQTGPVETLNARRGRKNQAIEQLKRLKRSYSEELMRTAVFIISAGEQREKFAEISSGKDINFFSADPEEFYKDLAKRVPPVLYMGKEGISNIFDVLGRHLEDKMNELDINEYNQLIFKASYARKCNSIEEFKDLIKEAINTQIGSEIVGIQAVRSLVPTAIDQGHFNTFTPIILTTSDEKLALSLEKDLRRLNSRVYLVLSGNSGLSKEEGAIVIEEVTKDAVKKTLSAIKKTFKNK